MSTYKQLPTIRPKISEDVRHWSTHALFAVGAWGRRYRWWLVVAALLLLLFFGLSQFRSFRIQSSAAELDRAMGMTDSPAQQAELKKIVDRFTSTPSANIARLLMAQNAWKKGDLATAQSLFEELRKTKGLSVFFHVAVDHALAGVLVDLDKTRDAIALYEASANLPGNVLKLASLYQSALLRESIGDDDAARMVYQNIIDTQGKEEESIKAMSKERILWLTEQKKRPS